MPRSKDMSNDVSFYREMASLVTVARLKSPLGPPLRADESIGKARRQFTESAFEEETDWRTAISLVLIKDVPVGYCNSESFFEAANDEESVDTITQGIASPQVIAANTPYIDAVDMLAERPWPFFFILDKGELTGTVRFDDLLKPIGLLCLFSLTLELEDAALRLCQAFAKQCWDALLQKRQDKAISIYDYQMRKRRLPQSHESAPKSYQRLVGCTAFSDKGHMIARCKLVPDWGFARTTDLFKLADTVRNACAHPASVPATIDPNPEFPNTASKLYEFVRNCILMIESIWAAMPKHLVIEAD